MLMRQRAKKATILLPASDGGVSGPVASALIAFLIVKGVPCLQVEDRMGNGLEIQFVAKPAKADFLVGIAALIAPSANIDVADTTIVRG